MSVLLFHLHFTKEDITVSFESSLHFFFKLSNRLEPAEPEALVTVNHCEIYV